VHQLQDCNDQGTNIRFSASACEFIFYRSHIHYLFQNIRHTFPIKHTRILLPEVLLTNWTRFYLSVYIEYEMGERNIKT
jgi:hypothetical protein